MFWPSPRSYRHPGRAVQRRNRDFHSMELNGIVHGDSVPGVTGACFPASGLDPSVHKPDISVMG